MQVHTVQQINVQYKICRWLDSNRGPLILEASALPTEPQPLPTSPYLWEGFVSFLFINCLQQSINKRFKLLASMRNTIEAGSCFDHSAIRTTKRIYILLTVFFIIGMTCGLAKGNSQTQVGTQTNTPLCVCYACHENIVYLFVLRHFEWLHVLRNELTPASFLFIFVLFKHNFYGKNCRLQQDSNLD